MLAFLVRDARLRRPGGGYTLTCGMMIVPLTSIRSSTPTLAQSRLACAFLSPPTPSCAPTFRLLSRKTQDEIALPNPHNPAGDVGAIVEHERDSDLGGFDSLL